MPSHPSDTPSPPLVALAGWLLPGAGYFLLGQRSRGMVVGVTILLLFSLGLLIGGVRVLEVPGFDSSGKKVMVTPMGKKPDSKTNKLEATGEPRWVLYASPLGEIRNKPWSVPQVLSGPVSLAAAAWSVWAAGPDPQHPNRPRGQQSHARINEIGSLYLSIAGLLNLLSIIDASHRAAQRASAQIEGSNVTQGAAA